MRMISFHYDSEIEEFYPYRRKHGNNVVATFCDDTGVYCQETEKVINTTSNMMWSEIEEFLKARGYQMDNHIVFKLKNCPLYWWVCDGRLYLCNSIVNGDCS